MGGRVGGGRLEAGGRRGGALTCSREMVPSRLGAWSAWRKRPTNLVESSRIDFSLRPSFSAAEPPTEPRRPSLEPAASEAAEARPSFSLLTTPSVGSSRSSSTGGEPEDSRLTQSGSLEMPSHVYDDAFSFCTMSSDSSTLTMS